MKIYKILIILLSFFSILNGENLMLLGEYKEGIDVKGWVVSEKYDGIRAVWDGKNLISRSGKKFNAPKFWLENFPNFKIDGELWTALNDFENLSSIVKDKIPDKEWNNVKFMIFDVPDAKGDLFSRLKVLKDFLDKNPNNFIKIIKQISINSNKDVKKYFNDVIKKGGEGVVVRDPKEPYVNKRSNKILKLKQFHDDECEVIKINMGNGKYSGKMGSLSCKNLKDGAIFKIGSGFDDKLRENPPKIGDIITYKFQNLTKNGKPRFPVFLRIRDDFQ